MPSQLTIVIPAKNEAERLPRLLASLCWQEYLRDRETKVYVADAGSTDCTREIAEEFRDRLAIEVIAGGLPAAGRNAGAKLATTPYVLFLDADVEFSDPTLIGRAVAAAVRRGLHCVTTDIACLGDGGSGLASGCDAGAATGFASELNRSAERDLARDQESAGSGNRAWAKRLGRDQLLFTLSNLVQRGSRWVSPFATGMFMLFDRAEFMRLGGFDVRALYAEDYLLTKQVARRRFAVVPGKVFTSNRRFQRMGHARIAGMFLKTAVNSRNHDYFLREQGYWE